MDSTKNSLTIKVLGVGGAGGNAVAHLAREPLAGVAFAALNTDAAALARLALEKCVILGSKLTRGLGAGGDPERGRQAAEQDAGAVRELCEGSDVVFVVAGLGGGTGTGASPAVARIAHDCGALVFVVAILPFDFEGGRRRSQAAQALQELKEIADGVICLPNQKLLKIAGESTPAVQAFGMMNDFVARAVRSLWSLIARPGIVQIDFADICAVTKGRQTESAIAFAEAAGENRVAEVTNQLLAHPLVDCGAALADAVAVLVCITAGPGFAMGEVHQIMQRISRSCDGAHITMGAAIDETFTERLAVTMIVARYSEETNTAASRLTAEVPGIVQASPPVARVAVEEPVATALPNPTDKANLPQALRARKSGQRMRQGQLQLDIISRGRFEKSEPTIHHGQDLDVPTYIRRGVALN